MKFFLKVNLLLCGFICLNFVSIGQVYQDHFGKGNTIGVRVNSSDNNSNAIHSISGTNLIPDLQGASRFLAQATLGYNFDDIEYLVQTGIENWLEEEFEKTTGSYKNKVTNIHNDALNMGVTDSTEKNEYISYAFYESLFKQSDLLRQKTAFSLSQILVISPFNGNLTGEAIGSAHYYDLLYQDAFGNFRDILYNISRHVSMGYYLSTIKNAKADFNLGTYPDENYAREIMQLFTIGLYELNNDGSPKLDGEGKRIPTYDIQDIEQLSKVFTGMGPGGRIDTIKTHFSTGQGVIDYTVPMAMYDQFHDKTPKVMIDGTVLPANQPGLNDIDAAIDILFNHPNVGPFIGLRLIQQFVKSNPSAAYINRVATVFNNNGLGERGDLKAVIKAVLLDPEARDCAVNENTTTGKLLQPLERVTKLFKAFNLSTPSNRYYYLDHLELSDKLGQAFFAAPSVFNFFSPFYAESKYVAPLNLVSPEFEVHNTATAINYINWVEDALRKKPFSNFTQLNGDSTGLKNNVNDEPYLNFETEINELTNNGIDALLDRLDILLCAGQLSFGTRNIIKATLESYFEKISSYSNEKAVHDAIYFIMSSADFTILK